MQVPQLGLLTSIQGAGRGGVALGLCWGPVLGYKVQMPRSQAIEHYILDAIEQMCTLKQLKLENAVECTLI